MASVSVVALKDFDLDGHAIHAGEAVDLEPVQAAIRGRRGEVSLDPQMRPTYRTRDLAAAPVVALPIFVPMTTPLVSPRRGRRRKQLPA